MSEPYENTKGVNIRVTTDKRGKEHIDIYDKDPREPEHKSIHIKLDTDKGTGKIVDTTNEGKETTDVSCYLTTACMRHMKENFDDNCSELMTLRCFRDKYVSKEDIEHYYTIAPMIVEEIEKINDNFSVYNYIYENIVLYCVNAIKQGNYEIAYSRYKNSVLALENEYIKPRLEQRLIKVLKIKSMLN